MTQHNDSEIERLKLRCETLEFHLILLASACWAHTGDRYIETLRQAIEAAKKDYLPTPQRHEGIKLETEK